MFRRDGPHGDNLLRLNIKVVDFGPQRMAFPLCVFPPSLSLSFTECEILQSQYTSDASKKRSKKMQQIKEKKFFLKTFEPSGIICAWCLMCVCVCVCLLLGALNKINVFDVSSTYMEGPCKSNEKNALR